ncbi:hypothetical protein EUX98_g9712, partial [Antrodiella citrinella]
MAEKTTEHEKEELKTKLKMFQLEKAELEGQAKFYPAREGGGIDYNRDGARMEERRPLDHWSLASSSLSVGVFIMSHDSSVERSDVSDSLQIYRTLETYMDKLDIPEATDAIVGNMKSHIEHLRHHETLNMFVPTSNATLHVELDRVLLAMLDCAPCVEGRIYTIRVITACAEQAKEDHPKEEDIIARHMALGKYLR